MPIRFRCVYCNKLLGIARRKAGAVVNCPHCAEKLIVPTPADESVAEGTEGTEGGDQPRKETQEEPVAPPLAGAQLFERSDFEALLQPEPTFRSEEPEVSASSHPKPKPKPQRSSSPAPPAGPAPFAGGDRLPPLQPIPLDDAPQLDFPTEGIFISRSKATWISVIAVLVLAATFALGIVVGKMLR